MSLVMTVSELILPGFVAFWSDLTGETVVVDSQRNLTAFKLDRHDIVNTDPIKYFFLQYEAYFEQVKLSSGELRVCL